MTDTIQHVIVDTLDNEKPYSTATIAHGFVFLSGLIPTSRTGEVSRMSLRDQIVAVLDDVDTVLRACGTSIPSIVKATCYLVDADHFEAFNAVYGEYVNAPFPARTTVVTQLAAPGVLFEMDVVAVIEHNATADVAP